MGLTPGEFADLTPREFAALAAATVDEAYRDRERAAWSVVHMTTALRPRRTAVSVQVEIAKLLGPDYQQWRARQDQVRATTRDAT